MKESGMLLFPIFFPIILGTLLLFMKKTTKRKTMVLITAAGLLVTALAVICVLAQGEVSFTLFQLTTLLPIGGNHCVGAGRDLWIPVYGA